MLDMQPAFIRRLDTEGVVCPARSAGGQRRYSRVELGHIAALAALMSEGMTLAGAQRIIELENEVAELRRQLAAAQPAPRRPRPSADLSGPSARLHPVARQAAAVRCPDPARPSTTPAKGGQHATGLRGPYPGRGTSRPAASA